MSIQKKFLFVVYSCVIIFILSASVSSSRLPVVNGDSDNWGTILNDYLVKLAGEDATLLNETMVNGTNIYSSSINTTHLIDGTITNNDISNTTNLTLGEKITFTLGEVIDNIIDGWITITGGLNVTENITVSGNIKVGNINPVITENRIMSEGGFVSHGGYSGKNFNWSAMLQMWDYHHATTYHKITTGSGEFYDSTNIFCDYTADVFTSDDVGNSITVTSGSNKGAIAIINHFINSSCVYLEHNPGWNQDISGFDWKLRDEPYILFADEGLYHFVVGDDEESSFMIHVDNGTGFYGFWIAAVAGADQFQTQTIETDIKDYDGVVSQNIYMYSSTGATDVHSDMVSFESDSSGINDSDLHFMHFNIIGKGINNTISAFKIDPMVEDIISVGEADVLDSAYYESTNITSNVKDEGADVEVFINDNEYVYIGNSVNFTSMTFALSTLANRNINLEYYYCNSSHEYEELTIGTDTTNGFQISGSIGFSNPTNRGTCNTEYDGTLFSDKNNYTYVALKRTINNLNTPPVIDYVGISGSAVTFDLKNDLLKLNPVDTAPETCDTSWKGSVYFDISEDQYCVCTSNGWKEMDDTTADCS